MWAIQHSEIYADVKNSDFLHLAIRGGALKAQSRFAPPFTVRPMVQIIRNSKIWGLINPKLTIWGCRSGSSTEIPSNRILRNLHKINGQLSSLSRQVWSSNTGPDQTYFADQYALIYRFQCPCYWEVILEFDCYDLICECLEEARGIDMISFSNNTTCVSQYHREVKKGEEGMGKKV